MSRLQRVVLALLLVGLLACWGLLWYLITHPQPQPAVEARSAPAAGGSQRQVWQTLALPPTWTPTHTGSPSPTWWPVAPAAGEIPTPALSIRPTPAVDLTPTFVHPSSTLPIPTPVPLLTVPEDAITILLLGSDRRPDWDNWRTDAIQYLVIFPDRQRPAASLLSIPRDLYVYIPGFWMSRINFADLYGQQYGYQGGGFGLLNQTLLHNLGISADYYAKVDFDGLIGLVDLLGGIEVPVHCRLEDTWPYPDADGTYHRIVVEPGIQHLDGELALWYARSRRTTSVFAREWRQQQVLEAMWTQGKAMTPLEAIPSLYENTRNLFETNLGLDRILSLAVTAAQLDPADVRLVSIGANDVTPYTTPYGGAVFLPRWERIQPILAGLLTGPAVQRAEQDAVQVEVWNGSGHADWDRLAADRLYRQGFVPLISTPDGRGYLQTQLVVLDGAGKGSRAAALQSLFRVREENVSYQPLDQAAAPLRLIIGEDYVTCW